MNSRFISILFFISFLLSFNGQAMSGTVTFDQLSVSADLSVAKFNADIDRIYREFNTSTESSNIAADTLAESDMADDINPRIRTFEGASCEKVDDGLLNTTTVGTLSGAIPTGTAYPRGFRCDKPSTTARTWTASRWTFLDIDQNCDFQFSEVTIGAATPAVAANSIRISRVSTDATQVFNVQDLRTTSCASGTFDTLVDATGEANLDDVLSSGRIRVSADAGWAQGSRISWDGLTTTFTVLPGSVYINGKFRRNTANVSVPQTADDPANGTSGLDTGAIAASTRYYVYGAADQAAVKTFSVSISTNATTPTGITNYRKIGQILTDGSSSYISRDMLTYHMFTTKETVGGHVNFDGSTSPLAIADSFNVSSLTDGGVGTYTVTWDTDFEGTNYTTICSSNRSAVDQAKVQACQGNSETSGSVNIRVATPSTDAAGDGSEVNVIAFGDKRV